MERKALSCFQTNVGPLAREKRQGRSDVMICARRFAAKESQKVQKRKSKKVQESQCPCASSWTIHSFTVKLHELELEE